MAGVQVKVDNAGVVAAITGFRASLQDTQGLLTTAGNQMLASIARTFREEGSPAGSWPRLAASTMKKKNYTPGHKLLRLTDRLFKSIGFQVSGNTVTIGTQSVPYAAVHQFGSADRRGGSIGPQAKIAGRAAKTKSGRGRFQNIPARPYLVFRPEDPAKIASGFEAYLAAKLRSAGAVTTNPASGVTP